MQSLPSSDAILFLCWVHLFLRNRVCLCRHSCLHIVSGLGCSSCFLTFHARFFLSFRRVWMRRQLSRHLQNPWQLPLVSSLIRVFIPLRLNASNISGICKMLQICGVCLREECRRRPRRGTDGEQTAYSVVFALRFWGMTLSWCPKLSDHVARSPSNQAASTRRPQVRLAFLS